MREFVADLPSPALPCPPLRSPALYLPASAQPQGGVRDRKWEMKRRK